MEQNTVSKEEFGSAAVDTISERLEFLTKEEFPPPISS